MSRRPNKDDISIGEDRWITFGDLNRGQARAVPIDPLLLSVMPLLDLLETECVSGCCGVDAFSFWPDVIQNATSQLKPQDRECLVSNLERLQSEVEALQTDTVVSTRMNQYFQKSVFLELLRHIRSVLETLEK